MVVKYWLGSWIRTRGSSAVAALIASRLIHHESASGLVRILNWVTGIVYTHGTNRFARGPHTE